jgi:hypothetical protein
MATVAPAQPTGVVAVADDLRVQRGLIAPGLEYAATGRGDGAVQQRQQREALLGAAPRLDLTRVRLTREDAQSCGGGRCTDKAAAVALSMSQSHASTVLVTHALFPLTRERQRVDMHEVVEAEHAQAAVQHEWRVVVL